MQDFYKLDGIPIIEAINQSKPIYTVPIKSN